MMILVCSACLGLNRVAEDRVGQGPKCGKCSQALVLKTALDVNGATFSRFIEKSDLPVVVDFWASWCGPCQSMAPAYSQVASQLAGRAVLLKVNTETEQALSAQYNIRSIPALKIFKHGKLLNEVAGALSGAQLSAWIAQSLK